MAQCRFCGAAVDSGGAVVDTGAGLAHEDCVVPSKAPDTVGRRRRFADAVTKLARAARINGG